jgi:hypothetical protein
VSSDVTAQSTLIFLHIGKTAGTTLRRVLRRQYRRSQIMTVRARARPREETIPDFARLPEHVRARPRLILGHTVFGLHEAVPRPSTYLTMVRNPVSLVMSQYGYVQRTPGHRHHHAARGMTLEAYIASGIATEMDNSQTRAIAGDLGTPYGECSPEMLDRAKENLERWFAVCGITERFDESLLLLQRAFGWSNVCYVSANVARRRPEPTAAQLRTIERMNQLDLALYEHVGERFGRGLAEDAEFSHRLARFRRKNSAYRPWLVATETWPREIRRRVAPSSVAAIAPDTAPGA